MPTGNSWTTAEDERLIELWRKHKSFTQMAWEFPGRTRNACIGRLARLRHRLGVAMVPEGRQGHPPAPVKRKRRRQKTSFAIKTAFAPTAPRPEKILDVPPQARQLSLLELGPKDCRFIVSGSYTRQHLYCAADATGNVDEYGNNCYCTYHRRLMRAGFVHSV